MADKYNLKNILRLKSKNNASETEIQKLVLMAEQIFKKRPLLFKVLLEEGNKSLIEYIKEKQCYRLSKIYKKRRSELLELIYKNITGIFNENITDETIASLKNLSFIQTANHIGPLSHPLFVNSDLVNSLALAISQKVDQKKLFSLTLASSSVSLNNSSYPCHLIFHAKDNTGAIKEHRIRLQPKRKRMSAAYVVPPFQAQEINKAQEIINKKISTKEINKTVGQKVLEILDSVYKSEEVLNLKSYSEQITLSNHYFWQKLYLSDKSLSTELIHLDFENLITDLLLKYHLSGNTPISKLLFDKNIRQYGLEIFDNIIGAYLSKTKKGTVFFWAIVKERRVQLIASGNKLISQDGSIIIPLTPSDISNALKEKRIMPNLLINFLTLTGYHGINCFGGFSQVDYLSVMMDKWRLLLENIGDLEESKINKSIPTNTLNGDLGLIFLAGNDNSNNITPATFLDLIIYNEPNMPHVIASVAGNISLAQSLTLNFPDLYNILYAHDERIPELMQLTQENIINVLGLKNNKEFYSINI